jgi:hypothetical protein
MKQKMLQLTRISPKNETKDLLEKVGINALYRIGEDNGYTLLHSTHHERRYLEQSLEESCRLLQLIQNSSLWKMACNTFKKSTPSLN